MDSINNKDRLPNGHFAIGNKLGQGRNKIYEDPEEFLKACNEYFEWADTNPIMISELIKSGDRVGEAMFRPVQRPYTRTACAHYIGMVEKTFREYGDRDGFSTYYNDVCEIIDNQQIEGSLVGIFKDGLTARIQGIGDKRIVEGGDEKKPVKLDLGKLPDDILMALNNLIDG